jgi:hypothetical protein
MMTEKIRFDLGAKMATRLPLESRGKGGTMAAQANVRLNLGG